ncbi:MAG TPA: GRP family sugar transporter, partial [Solirubrobacteraceae bacterium]
SACYGIANYLGPLFTRRFPLGGVLLVGQVAAAVVAAIAVMTAGEAPPGAGAVGLAALAGIGNAIGLASFLRATELGPVSIVAPIGNTGTIVPVVYGLATGEALRALESIGIVLAIGGAVLAARVPERPDEPHPRDLRPCLAFATAGAIGFGLLLVALPPASEHGRWWALLDARLALVAFLVVLVLGRRESPRVPAAALPRLAMPGLLLIAGTLLYVLATERGAVSIASVCASLNPVVTVALSLALLGERVSRTQALGIAAAIAGVALIAA